MKNRVIVSFSVLDADAKRTFEPQKVSSEASQVCSDSFEAVGTQLEVSELTAQFLKKRIVEFVNKIEASQSSDK